MKHFTLDTIKEQIAHEWGHYIAFSLLGFQDKHNGFTIECNIYGCYGKNYPLFDIRKLSIEEQLFALYAGAITQGFYLGKSAPVCYTDAQSIWDITSGRRYIAQKARRKTELILNPFKNYIEEFVIRTIDTDKDCFDNFDEFNFDFRLFKDDAKMIYSAITDKMKSARKMVNSLPSLSL